MKKCLFLLLVIAFIHSVHTYAQTHTTLIVSTIAGTGTAGHTGDSGPATAAKLNYPSCLAFSTTGDLYINEQRSHCVRKLDKSGIITTIAGTGLAGYDPNGGTATATRLNLNWGIAVDNKGYVYITDQLNHRIRVVTTSGIMAAVGGTGTGPGTGGFSGDNGQATNAQFNSPIGVAVDAAGNVFVVDGTNKRVRKISTSGIVTTVAGNGGSGFTGNNVPATTATFKNIFGIAVDGSGNLFICDAENSCVRKVDGAGIITTIAGTGVADYTGDGGAASAATLRKPIGVYAHPSGDIYIADSYNNNIRKIDAAGIISTVAGSGIQGFNGDGLAALKTQLYHPSGIAFDSNDDMYILDVDNQRIRKTTRVKTLSFSGGRFQNFTTCANTPDAPINAQLAIVDYAEGATDSWSAITEPAHGTLNAGFSNLNTNPNFTPSGLAYTPYSGFTGDDTFTVQVKNGLASDTTTIFVHVTPAPNAGTISGDVRVCVGSSTKMSTTGVGGVWTSGGKNTTVADGLVTGVKPGIDTIFYTVTSACGNAVAFRVIRINPLPYPGKISGPNALCIGSSIELTTNKDGGTWSCSNASVSVNNGIVTALVAGTNIISYTITDSVCAASALHAIVIDTFPDAGNLSGAYEVCVGAQIVMNSSVASGQWKTSNDLAGLTNDPALPFSCNVTGKYPGTDTIYYSVTNSCGTAIAERSITIHPEAKTPVIAINRYFISVPAVYPAYQWTINGTTIPGAVSDTCQLRASGSYSIIVSDINGCMATADPFKFEGCSVDDLTIFPNPTQAFINVGWCKETTLKLMEMDGKNIQTYFNTNKVSLEGLPNTNYLITVYDMEGHKIVTQRISKTTK